MNIFAYLCALLKGVIYGSTIYFTGSLTKSTDALDILALRFLLSFAVMLLLKHFGVIRTSVNLRDIFIKEKRTPALKRVYLAALFEPVLYMLFETIGIAGTTGMTAAVIISMSPVVSCIFEQLFLHEKASPIQKLFLGCGIFGAVYIALNTSTSDGRNSLSGILFLVLAIMVGGAFAVCSRSSSKSCSAMDITYISCILGAAAFNSVNIVRHIAAGDILSYFAPYLSLRNIIGFVFLGVCSTIIATAMNNYALSKLKLSTVSAIGGVSTLVSLTIGVILENNSLQLYHLIGLPFILLRIIGVGTVSILSDRQKPDAENTKAEKRH